MRINWLIRIKNPLFWLQTIAAMFLAVLAYYDLSPESLTNWAILGDTLLDALSNPYILGLVFMSTWSAITDPTTKGIGDSEKALQYTNLK